MRTDLLNGLLALKWVAEKGTFTAAANEMGISTSAISQTIKQLEAQLGCVLLNRTTRSSSLTEIGHFFLQQYKPGLEQIFVAMEQLGRFTGKPWGTLRLNLPRGAWTSVIAPVLAGFQKQYPEITVEIFFQDSFADIAEGGFDAGIRPSEMTAKDMTAIRISPPFSFVVAGSPAYFKAYGRPEHPQELTQHNCVLNRFGEGTIYKRWEFVEAGRDFSVSVNGNLVINDTLVIVECALRGLGLIYTTDELIQKQVAQGELEICLSAFAPPSDGFYLYYPNLNQVSPKLRAFIDYLKAYKRTQA